MKRHGKVKIGILAVVAVFLLIGVYASSALPSLPQLQTGGRIIKASSDYYPLLQLYPEDYSFRSGMIKSVTICDGECVIEGDQIVANQLKQENNIWNSRYPFKDPQDAGSFQWQEFVTQNVGFKAKIVRQFPESGTGLSVGRVSYNLALVPFLEAKETVVFDGENPNNYKVFGERTEFDIYGNPKKVYSLGFTGEQRPVGAEQWGDTFEQPVYFDYTVRNPTASDPAITVDVSSENTNLQRTNFPIGHNETEVAKRDTTVTETTFLYEYGPESVSGNGLYWIFPYLFHSYYGWTHLPYEINTEDAYGRLISNTKTFYPREVEDYQACLGVSDHSMGTDELGWNCYEKEYGTPPQTYRLCERQKPEQILSNTNTYAFGEQEANYVYDQCGNMVSTEVKAPYKHPRLDLTPDGAGLFDYQRTVESGYDAGERIRPTTVTTYDPANPGLSISMEADYWGENLIKTSINERGEETKYFYDDIGRIEKVVAPYDTGSSPSAEYQYSTYYMGGGAEGLKIYEKIKIDGSHYKETYYFYDGMGRHVQTKMQGGNSIILSGRIYDVLGRVNKEYRPVELDNSIDITLFEGGYYNNEGTFEDTSGNEHYVTYLEYDYDALGRVTSVTDTFDNASTTKDYDVAEFQLVIGEGHESVDVTDPNGNIRTFTSDAMGNLVSVDIPGL
jgi:YD repeat-containing protein